VFRRSFTRPKLLVLLLLYFIVNAAFSGFEATFALFGERRFEFTAANIGYVFALIGVVLAVVQGVLVGRVVRRVGEHRLIPAALAAVALALAAIALAPSVPLLLAACATLALGMGFNNPSMSSMVSRLTDPNEQGGVLGLAQSLGSLGRIVGPVWGGLLFDRYGAAVPCMTAAAIMSVAFVVALTSLSAPRT
jgi:DHA1 family tetracycline resistance protein-like MFS transporter